MSEIFKSFMKKFKQQKKPIIISELLVLILAIGYLAGAIYFNDKFMIGTTIDGIDVGALTVSQANDKIAKSVSNNSIAMKFSDGNEETLDSSLLGVTYNANNSIKNVKATQNSFGWIAGLFGKNENHVNDLISIDEIQLTNGLNNLEHLKPENQAAPVNAGLTIAEGKLTISPEQFGTQIDNTKLINVVKEMLVQGKTSVDLAKSDVYVQPEITSTNESLVNKLEVAKANCDASLKYTTSSGKTFTLDGLKMSEWLVQGEDGKYTYDEETFKTKLKEYITTVANSYNNVGGTRTFTGADGAQHTVSGGSFGVRISISKEVDEALELIKAGTIGDRTPVTTGGSVDAANGGFGDTFVEIDITRQHFWFHKNGTVVVESDIVTGKSTDPERATPTGAYFITYKQRDRVLRGTKLPDGTYPYESPVSYWMPFNKGIGLHDASWRNTFGGSIYINGGSHGCINLPVGTAKTLYEALDTNTPVIVYKS